MNQNSAEYWDFRLTPSPENECPLSPKGIVITKKEYDANNRAWRKSSARVMRPEIQNLDRSIGSFVVTGVGLGRDYDCVKMAVLLGLSVEIKDFSKVACNNARGLLRRQGLLYSLSGGRVKIEKEEIKPEHIDKPGVVAHYVSQFIEHQGPNLQPFMYEFGKFIKRPGCKLFLRLPCIEDNPPDNVHWESAAPPSFDDWQIPLSQGCGKRVKLTLLLKNNYFNRKYRLYRCEANI